MCHKYLVLPLDIGINIAFIMQRNTKEINMTFKDPAKEINIQCIVNQ